jgi:hypothetical protein
MSKQQMNSLGQYAKVGHLEVTDSITTTSHNISTNSANVHELSSNGSAVYFKYLMELEITSLTTTAGSATVTATCVEDHGLNHGGASGAIVTLRNFVTSDDLDGLEASDFEGEVTTINWTNALTAKQFQFTAASGSATAGATIACTAKGTIRVYKYLELAGDQVDWQIQYNSAPVGSHNN